MNPFQTYNARVNTAAAQLKMNPAVVKSILAATAAAQVAPLAGGIIDTTVGDTHGMNSGEIPLNYLIAALGGGVSAAGMVGNEYLNQQLDDRFKQATGPRTNNVSAHDTNMKAKLKEIQRTQGADAAAAYFTSQQSKNQNARAAEGTYTMQGAAKRRMAGNLLAALAGAGLSLPFMVDEQY